MRYYQCDMTERAVGLYFRLMKRRGATRPTSRAAAVPAAGGNDVVLRNVRGELARHRLRPAGGMRLARPRRSAGV